MKNIDIIYTLNEDRHVTIGENSVLKVIPFIEQVIKSIKSFKKNWISKNINYQFIVLYSLDMTINNKRKLEKHCDILLKDHNPLDKYNRSSAYKFDFGGDYSLVLDTDTICLNPLKLEFDKEIYIMPTSKRIDERLWKFSCKYLNVKYEKQSSNPLDLHRRSKPFKYHMHNNGTVFISNKIDR